MFDFKVALIESVILSEINKRFIGFSITDELIYQIKNFANNRVSHYYQIGELKYRPRASILLHINTINFMLCENDLSVI
jgi:hypothetical protein